MELVLRAFELPLRHEFRISRGSRKSQRTLIVDLSVGECHGYGEATESSYYQVSLGALQQAIEAVRPILAEDVAGNPSELWERLRPLLASQPFALCAIDEAVWDLHGKLLGKPLHQLWGQSIATVPASDYTLGIDRLDVMLAKLQEMPDWPIYKIKLGTPYDLEIVQELRKRTPATFRVDANGGWSLEQALKLIPELAKLGVEFVEQPLASELWEEQRELFQKSPLPLLADESCLVEKDVARCQNHFHGINIKLVKCGGLTPARRMIAEARARQLSVMVGCMTESTVGISAIAQLLPQLDYVDMDGAVLLAADTANGAWLNRGVCQFPPGPGSGVMLRADSSNYEIPLASI
jgi:L-Ala-D/L-Glu epimerase